MNSIICYFIASVITLAHMNGVQDTKLTYGAKQIVTELANDKYTLCDTGRAINVEILSIEAPTKGIRVGPFEFKQKKTIVKTKIIIDGKEYIGEGSNKTSVSSTLLQLQDEKLPFEITDFSSALRQSLENAMKK
jgi:hypothetical protein